MCWPDPREEFEHGGGAASKEIRGDLERMLVGVWSLRSGWPEYGPTARSTARTGGTPVIRNHRRDACATLGDGDDLGDFGDALAEVALDAHLEGHGAGG